MGVPAVVVKTSLSSAQTLAASRSRRCAVRCDLRTATRLGGIASTRTLPSVLGAVSTSAVRCRPSGDVSPVRCRWSERAIATVPAVRSMSVHRRASASPRRRPRVMRTSHNANSRSVLATAMSCLASSRVSGWTFLRGTRPGWTSSAGLRGISSSRTASVSARRSVAWASWMVRADSGRPLALVTWRSSFIHVRKCGGRNSWSRYLPRYGEMWRSTMSA